VLFFLVSFFIIGGLLLIHSWGRERKLFDESCINGPCGPAVVEQMDEIVAIKTIAWV